MQEWKEKALTLETKANELEMKLSAVKVELEKVRTVEGIKQSRAVFNKQIVPLASTSKQLEGGKQAGNLKENHHNVDKVCKEVTAREMLTTEQNSEIKPRTDSQPISLGKQLEKEKRMLRHLKEKYRRNDKGSRHDKGGKQELPTDGRRNSHTCRLPFREIGNLSTYHP